MQESTNEFLARIYQLLMQLALYEVNGCMGYCITKCFYIIEES